MALKLHLSRILAATFVLLALLAVPSIAQAHAGHDHGLQPAASASTGVDPASLDGSTAGLSVSVEALDVQDSAPDQMPGCTGTCCSGTPCGGCIAFSFVDASPYGPPIVAAPGEWRDPLLSAGFAPEGLRKPPRSFI